MANLIEIQAQIENLKKQAEAIRSKEFAATVADIREKMAAFGITIKDLQPSGAKRGRKAKIAEPVKRKGRGPAKTAKASPSVAAKYIGPNGETWSGRGLTPKWLKSLIDQGQSKESFAVATPPAA